MAKPPKIVVPGLNRGAGIPGRGELIGRLPRSGRGPAQLLDLQSLGQIGIASRQWVQAVVAKMRLIPGPPGQDGDPGEDGPPGPPGQPGSPGSAGAPGGTGPAGPPGFAIDGVDGDEGMPIPGPPGTPGAAGAMGPQGPIGFAIDGVDGDEGMPIPGNQGTPGLQGVQGPPGFALDGSDGDDGARGPTGDRGPIGPAGPPNFALDGDEGPEGFAIPGNQGTPGIQGVQGPPGASWQEPVDYADDNWSVAASTCLPLAGGVMNGGSAAFPSIGLGSSTVGFYGDGSNIYGALNGINKFTIAPTGLTITTTGAVSSFTGARSEATIAAATNVLSLIASAQNSTGAGPITYGSILVRARVTTTGSETATLNLQTFHGGALTTDFAIDSGNFYAGSFSAANLVLDGLQNFYGQPAHSFSRQIPTTGFSITIGNQIGYLILKPAGTLATGTITMPTTPVDGQEVGIASSQQITALTVQANTGQTLDGGLAAALFAANGFARWKYVLTDTTWFRVG